MFLWQIYVAGNNKTHLGLHVKCLIFSDFNEIWVSGQERPEYEI
jgi:hypothetical protein